MITPLQLGATYTAKKYLITASAYIQPNGPINYYLSPEVTGATSLNPLSLNISFIGFWDTDKSMRNPKGIQQENLKHEILKRDNKLNSWYWGIGPSAVLQISKSSYLKNRFPYLYNDYAGGVTADVTLGRYFSKHDINIEIAYRHIAIKAEAFDSRVKLRRQSYTLEGYKYLFNYLGFVPFAGVAASIESLRANSNGDNHRQFKAAFGCYCRLGYSSD